MIKAIIFDNNGVLSHRSEDIYTEAVELLKKEGWKGSVKDFLSQWHEAKKEEFTGKASLEDTVKKFCRIAGIQYKPEILDIVSNMKKKYDTTKDLCPGVKETLEILKKKYKLAVLTDASHSADETIKFFKEKGITFDLVLSSRDIGFTKHNKEAFQIMLNKLGMKPEEVVFVGHSPHEIKTAMEIGIFTISMDKNVKGNMNLIHFSDILVVLKKLETGNQIKGD